MTNQFSEGFAFAHIVDSHEVDSLLIYHIPQFKSIEKKKMDASARMTLEQKGERMVSVT